MTRTKSVLAVLAVMGLAMLACETGQVLPPDQATEAAILTRQPVSTVGAAEGGEFQPGDTVEFAGVSFLIPLRSSPGDTTANSHVSRGDTGTILEIASIGDIIWYRVDSQGGEGWVLATDLAASSSVAGAFAVDDEPFLVGTAFLINLYDGPGSSHFIAGQERGVTVTVLEVAEANGEAWYRIDAPTGEGWVPEENLSAEPPS